MLIVSLLLGGLLISLSATQESNYRNQAATQLEEALEALYGFAQVNGRLPCPATAVSNGLEAPVGGGACIQQHGFIPAATLGLSGNRNDDDLLTDSWASPLRYTVSSANGNAFTTANGMRNTTIANLTPDLRICGESACATVITNTAPAVILSLGSDWASFDAADIDEIENSGETTINGYRLGNDTDFVQTNYIENTFDDIIQWMSPNILYTRMISSGQLP